MKSSKNRPAILPPTPAARRVAAGKPFGDLPTVGAANFDNDLLVTLREMQARIAELEAEVTALRLRKAAPRERRALPGSTKPAAAAEDTSGQSIADIIAARLDR